MIEKALTELGFSINEAKVYLTLLKLGSTTAGDVAKKSKIYRTNVYEALNRLVDKGLTSYIFKGHQKFFQAEHPEKIMEIINEKKEKLLEILPELTSNHLFSKNKEKAHIYEGIQGLKAITNEILRVQKDVVTFGVPKNISEIMENFNKTYHKKRINLKMKQKHLYDQNATERIKYLNTLKYTEARYLPGAQDSPATTTIFGDNVSFFIWSDPILCLLIESKRMADSYRKYFNILWNMGVKS